MHRKFSMYVYMCVCVHIYVEFYRHGNSLQGTKEIVVAISGKERGFLLFAFFKIFY